MIESNLVAGAQKLVPGQPLIYGQSITDGCIDWAETRGLLKELAAAVKAAQGRRNRALTASGHRARSKAEIAMSKPGEQAKARVSFLSNTAHLSCIQIKDDSNEDIFDIAKWKASARLIGDSEKRHRIRHASMRTSGKGLKLQEAPAARSRRYTIMKLLSARTLYRMKAACRARSFFALTSAARGFGLLLLVAAWAAEPAPETLTTLAAVHALSNAEASKKIHVALEATVVYARRYEHLLYLQDGNEAIFVYAPTMGDPD